MKKTRLLLVLALVFALFLSFAPTAMAEPPYNAAAITKILQVPEGTEFPTMGFEFRFTPERYNGSTEDLVRVPTIGVPQSATTGVITINVNRATANLEGTVNRVSTYYVESGNFVAGVTFPNAGVYDYLVTEIGSTYNITSPLHEALELSEAVYRVSILVQENNGVPFVYHVGVVRITTDDGDPGSEKVDPTPGGNGTTTEYSQMTFTNKYVRTNGANNPDNPNPQKPPATDPTPGQPYNGDSTLNIGNQITGLMGSQILPFDFGLRIDVPTLIPEYVLPFYKAHLVDSTGVLNPTGTVNASLIGQDANGMRYIRFAPGTVVDFQLKHGQTLVFINTPVGTAYNVTQAAEAGYTTTIQPFYNSIKETLVTALTYAGLVGERFNAANYTNAFTDTTPTGLNVNDLPFYGLILLAVGGLAVFIIVKARKRNRG